MSKGSFGCPLIIRDIMRYFFGVVSFVWAFSCNGFQVQPMVADLMPSGTAAQQTLRIMNNSAEALTVEISAFDLDINLQGEEKLVNNEDDFLIIPMTTIIPAGKSQSVMVRYIGEPIINTSKSYRIVVDQVAVDIGEMKGSGVGMSVSFHTLFNVVPKQARAKLLIKSQQQDASGLWKVLIENQGNKYVRLSDAKWQFKHQENTLLLQGKELREVLSNNVLLPQSTQEVSIKVPLKFPAQSSELEVLF